MAIHWQSKHRNLFYTSNYELTGCTDRALLMMSGQGPILGLRLSVAEALWIHPPTVYTCNAHELSPLPKCHPYKTKIVLTTCILKHGVWRGTFLCNKISCESETSFLQYALNVCLLVSSILNDNLFVCIFFNVMTTSCYRWSQWTGTTGWPPWGCGGDCHVTWSCDLIMWPDHVACWRS